MQISCPNCFNLQSSDQIKCNDCGVDLLTATAIAEKKSISNIEKIDSHQPIAPEMLVPRLGDLLVNKGLITPDQLRTALNLQKNSKADNVPLLLGTTLIVSGYISASTLDHVVTEQIYLLQEALKESNDTLEAKVAKRTDDLSKALTKLSELNQLKNNFVSNISHELKTPLAQMIGYIYLLEENLLGEINTEQGDAVKIIKKNYNRLNELITNLVDFSIASQKNVTLSTTEFKITDLIEKISTYSKNSWGNKNIQFKSIPNTKSYKILADFKKIEWVVEELIKNAVKFAPNNELIVVSFEANNKIVNFSVKDNGIGISKEDTETIFEEFSQGDGSSTRMFGGVGIGLSLVKEILSSHGTNLNISSILGEGTTMSFSLPQKI
jgi:signal transduction histidine kinase